jgi:uncharacterized protein (TIGR03435 family)
LPVLVGLVTSPRVSAQTANSSSASIAFGDVKITKASGEGNSSLGIGNNQKFSVHNQPLRLVIAWVYDVDHASVVGGPDWLDKPLYNIVANTRTAVNFGDDMRPLTKSMLVDRFGLQAHPEVRQVAAFDLRVDQGGSKLSSAPAFSSELSGSDPPRSGIWASPNFVIGTYVDLKVLTQQISEIMGRPVIDKTGLTGRYDFTLRGPRASEALPAELQEQLGLRLEAVTAPIDVIVVDDIQQPTLDVQ